MNPASHQDHKATEMNIKPQKRSAEFAINEVGALKSRRITASTGDNKLRVHSGTARGSGQQDEQEKSLEIRISSPL
jgi:hypothetical protein